MPSYTYWDNSTGQITGNSTAGDINEARTNCSSGISVVEGRYSDVDYWINAGAPTRKGSMNPSVNGATISGLPDPCLISVDTAHPIMEEIRGGVYTVDKPRGSYFVRIKGVRHKEIHLRITIP